MLVAQSPWGRIGRRTFSCRGPSSCSPRAPHERPRRIPFKDEALRGLVQAALLVIGDEILSGHTQDTNSWWIAKRLHPLGVSLVETRVVPDVAARIQGSIWELQERREADVVICCGGLGPTHDDRTVAALAALHGVPLVRHTSTWEWLAGRHARLHEEGKRPSATLTAASEKMCLVPAGAEVFRNEAGAAPGLAMSRTLASRPGEAWTFVLPGVPQELQTLWSQHLEPRLVALLGTGARKRHVAELLYRGYESEAAEIIQTAETDHPGVAIGSYPHWGKKEVVLRVSGPDPAAVETTRDALEEGMRRAGHQVERLARDISGPNA